MGYVFISYSSKEQDTAKAMCALLKKNGIETWIAPDDIPAGGKYAAAINRAVKNCSCFLLLLSDAAQQSKWVPKEVERAINYDKTIITAKMEDVELNDEFEFYISTDQMERIKAIDEDSKNIKKLIKSIIAYTGQKEKPETIKTPEPVKAIEKPKIGNTEKEPAPAKKESTADKQSSLIKRLPNGNIEFGHYEQEIGKVSPIEWIVLEEEKNKMLVISRYALDCQRYNSKWVDVTWETCTLRKWLNEDFMREAFRAKEQELILNTEVTADPNPEYDTLQGRNTTDKVFLLSIKEAEVYFHSDEERKCQGTDYCFRQGAYKGYNGKCWWWLRSPGNNSRNAASVISGGFIGHRGDGVSLSYAVRPALWINLESNQLEKMESVKPIEKPKTGNTEKEPARAKKESTADKQISLIKRLPNGNIEFGHYEQEIGKISPIEWIVLEEEKNKMLLISRYALDYQRYNSEFVNVTWETCTLRKWLNEDFMRRAFTAEEQRMILNTEVTADPNPNYDTSQRRNTTDKVFLLSIKEAEKYFNSREERKCRGTAYCYAQGAYKYSNGNCWWWLRSRGYRSNLAPGVRSDGAVDYRGSYVHRDSDAVRPALWINLES